MKEPEERNSLPEVPITTIEEKHMWMTNFFCNDTALALTKLEEMGVNMEQFIDELSSWWPKDLWNFGSPEEAIQFVLKTFGNFHGAEARFLKCGDKEAVGELKCAVPNFVLDMPKKRGFARDLNIGISSRYDNVWCKYWCKHWFNKNAEKEGWDLNLEHKGDLCIWKAKKIAGKSDE